MAHIRLFQQPPIISLLKIGKLTLLKELYEKVIIPTAVYREIENGRKIILSRLITIGLDWIGLKFSK